MSGLLRICTAGSVDDGKSTLIGRMLHDSQSVYEDQVHSVRAASKNGAAGPLPSLTFLEEHLASPKMLCVVQDGAVSGEERQKRQHRRQGKALAQHGGSLEGFLVSLRQMIHARQHNALY